MKGLIYVIAGLLLIIVALFALMHSSWLWATIRLVQGSIVIALVLIGLGLLFIGASELKN